MNKHFQDFLSADGTQLNLPYLIQFSDDLFARVVDDLRRGTNVFDAETSCTKIRLMPTEAPSTTSHTTVAAVQPAQSSTVQSSVLSAAPTSNVQRPPTNNSSSARPPAVVKGPAAWLDGDCDHPHHATSLNPVRPHKRRECHQYSKDQARGIFNYNQSSRNQSTAPAQYSAHQQALPSQLQHSTMHQLSDHPALTRVATTVAVMVTSLETALSQPSTVKVLTLLLLPPASHRPRR